MALWILLLLVGSSYCIDYRGTVMTYYPKNSTNGSYTVELRYKLTTSSCLVLSLNWECLSMDCGRLVSETSSQIDFSNSSTFGLCQTETIRTLELPTNAPFQLRVNDSGGMVTLVRALTVVELRNRSDTKRANRSPQTTITDYIRFPSNCPRDIPLLAFDPDGDQVVCRYGTPPFECDPCTQPPFLTVSPSCTLAFNPTSDLHTGWYPFEMVMEDFPKSNITLTQNNGTQELKTTTDYLSRIPLQFPFYLTPPVPSCTEGVYLPKFVGSTPEHGAQLYLTVGSTKVINIQAQASNTTISGLFFSGPTNMSESSLGNGSFILTWTPTVAENGETYPLCFSALAYYNFDSIGRMEIQSEMRCVILNVGTAEPTAPTVVHESGLVMTYYRGSTAADGSVLVTFRSKLNLDSCSKAAQLNCSGEDCGNITKVESFIVDREQSGGICQTETLITRRLTTNAPFQIQQLRDWVTSIGDIFFFVDFRTRSDSGRPNRPPLSTLPPVIRLPYNCARTFKILAFDDDGDQVKLCDYYTTDSSCGSCNSFSSPGAAKFCSKDYFPGIASVGTFNVVQTLKDFPKETISLIHSNGSTELKTPTNSISKLGFHAVLNVDPPVPSCTDGLYLPKYLPPTPEYGTIYNISMGQTLTLTIKAQANVSTISELLFSGPHDIQQKMTGEGEFLLTWSPSESEAGQSHPVCFVVQAMQGSRKYQTEPLCVVFKVDPKPYNPLDNYFVALDTVLLSTTAIDKQLFMKEVRNELIRRGLPPEIIVEVP